MKSAPTSDQALQGNHNATEVIVEGGYIRVIQDVRGKYQLWGRLRDEPPLFMVRRIQPPVDHSTDTYDTIDWLVKNIPAEQRQGRHPGYFL